MPARLLSVFVFAFPCVRVHFRPIFFPPLTYSSRTNESLATDYFPPFLGRRARRDLSTLRAADFGRARGWRQACRPGTKVFGLLGRHSRRKPQKMIRHLRPSVVARRLVGVLRCASDTLRVSAHSQQSKPRIRLRMHEVVSRRIDVHGQEPFGLQAGTGLRPLPMFAGHTCHLPEPGRFAERISARERSSCP